MQLVDIIQMLIPILKLCGYKKKGLTWQKRIDNLSILFAIQKSQYSNDMWYYSFGVSLNELTGKKTVSMSDCQIQYHLEKGVKNVELTVNDISNLIKKWEEKYGTVEQLRKCAIEGRLPVQTSNSAMRYLTSVNLATLTRGQKDRLCDS